MVTHCSKSINLFESLNHFSIRFSVFNIYIHLNVKLRRREKQYILVDSITCTIVKLKFNGHQSRFLSLFFLTKIKCVSFSFRFCLLFFCFLQFFIRENRRRSKNNTLNNLQNYTMNKNMVNVTKYILNQ